MATFTTWTSLYQTMLNAAADFAAGRMQIAEYNVETGGSRRNFKYRSWQEFQEGLQFVKTMADTESGAAVGRTYASQGGTGRW